jgi:hypothetical protein
MKSSDKPKLIFAVAILVVAGVVIAWQMGLFGDSGTKTVTPPAPEAAKAGGARTAPGVKK